VYLTAGIAMDWLNANRNVLRNFDICEMFLRKDNQIIHVDLLSRTRHDYRSNLLSHHLVGHSDHRDFKYCGVRSKRVLDFNAVNVLTASAYHVLLAIDDLHEALIVYPSHIPGVQPAVDERLGCSLRFVPITFHDVRSPHEQFARAGGWVFLKQIEINNRRGEADCLRPLVREFVRKECSNG